MLEHDNDAFEGIHFNQDLYVCSGMSRNTLISRAFTSVLVWNWILKKASLRNIYSWTPIGDKSLEQDSRGLVWQNYNVAIKKGTISRAVYNQTLSCFQMSLHNFAAPNVATTFYMYSRTHELYVPSLLRNLFWLNVLSSDILVRGISDEKHFYSVIFGRPTVNFLLLSGRASLTLLLLHFRSKPTFVLRCTKPPYSVMFYSKRNKNFRMFFSRVRSITFVSSRQMMRKHNLRKWNSFARISLSVLG